MNKQIIIMMMRPRFVVLEERDLKLTIQAVNGYFVNTDCIKYTEPMKLAESSYLIFNLSVHQSDKPAAYMCLLTHDSFHPFTDFGYSILLTGVKIDLFCNFLSYLTCSILRVCYHWYVQDHFL